MENSPTVFISYSHDSEEHKNWVLKLATDLTTHGVMVIFDQWDLRLGQDLRFFMESGLSQSRLILCVCSLKYVEKVDCGVGGSGYEGTIISNALLQNQNLDYIIPVVVHNESEQKVPTFLSNKLYVDFSDPTKYFEKYAELLARIYGEDEKKRPQKGANPFSDDLAKRIEIKTKLESVLYHTPTFDGEVSFCYDNNNGVYKIGNGEYEFDTRWSGAGSGLIYVYGLIGYKKGICDFPALDNIYEYDYSSRARTVNAGEVFILENLSGHFAAIKVGQVLSSSHGDEIDNIKFSYHIYELSS